MEAEVGSKRKRVILKRPNRPAPSRVVYVPTTTIDIDAELLRLQKFVEDGLKSYGESFIDYLLHSNTSAE